MATATGTNVKFVKVKTKKQYNDYTDKDGALIFVEDEKKIYVDGIAYGFSMLDVSGAFVELGGDTMTGDLNLGHNDIYDVGTLNFSNRGFIYASEDEEVMFFTSPTGDPLIELSGTTVDFFGATSITGIPEPKEDDSPISKGYLKTNVIDKIGVENGIATLDKSGKVPSGQLPSYVDDVLEYSDKESFPAVGVSDKLYVDTDTNRVYRWGGTAYVNVSDGNAHLEIGTTSSTAFRGDHGKTAYDHTKITTTNPHNVTKSDVKLGSVENYGIANEAEAKAGSSSQKYMTPQRTKQAIEHLAPKLSWTVVA